MKKICCFFIYSVIYGQVGIGTLSPKATLDIISSNKDTKSLKITNDSGIDNLTVLSNGNIGLGTSNPTTSLQIVAQDPNNPSSSTGLVVPIVTKNPASGIEKGQILYNSTLNSYQYWDGNSWNSIISNNKIYYSNSNAPLTIKETDLSEQLIPGTYVNFTLTKTSIIKFLGSINFSSTSSVFSPIFLLKLTDNSGVTTAISKVKQTYLSDGIADMLGNLELSTAKELTPGTYSVAIYAFYNNCCNYNFSYTVGGIDESVNLIVSTYEK